MLASGHALSDFYATVFCPLVETFRALFDLSLTGISAIGTVIGVFGSMMQPAFGILGDRADRGMLAAAGLLVSAIFISLIGLAPNVYMLTALLTVGALGVAAFHPSGATLAARTGRTRHVAIAFFTSGGGVGLVLAPLAVAAIVRGADDLPWLWLIALPGVGLSVWLFVATRGQPRAPAEGRVLDLRALFARGSGPLWALFGMATMRSVVFVSFTFFITVLGKTRGWGLADSSGVLSLFLACSVIGSLVGGIRAQRGSPRALLATSCIVAAPFFYGFAWMSGWVSIAAFAGAGLFAGMGTPVNISFAQELRPQSASMVSGLMMGMAWGIATVIRLAVGYLAEPERLGIEATLQLVAWLSALAGAFAVFLPSRHAARGSA